VIVIIHDASLPYSLSQQSEHPNALNTQMVEPRGKNISETVNVKATCLQNFLGSLTWNWLSVLTISFGTKNLSLVSSGNVRTSGEPQDWDTHTFHLSWCRLFNSIPSFCIKCHLGTLAGHHPLLQQLS
jgi:hypothetical protein